VAHGLAGEPGAPVGDRRAHQQRDALVLEDLARIGGAPRLGESLLEQGAQVAAVAVPRRQLRARALEQRGLADDVDVVQPDGGKTQRKALRSVWNGAPAQRAPALLRAFSKSASS
jgi:beta-phosphoglucomutase-like phosphatase (HAD superfamily)